MTGTTHGKLDGPGLTDDIMWDGWRWTPTTKGAAVTIKYCFDVKTIGKTSTKTWASYEQDAYVAATDAWSEVANVKFVQTGSAAAAQFDEALVSGNQLKALGLDPKSYAAYHDAPQQASSQSDVANGYFAYANYTASTVQSGSYYGQTYIHELGHGLGLKHPFDTIGSAGPLPGVKKVGDLGDHDLSHTFWTIMSYNSNYKFDQDGHIVLLSGAGRGAPDGTGPGTNVFGYDLGPMALDIAAVQHLYGANMKAHTGNDVYTLPDANADGTGWKCIWDAGGTDELRYNGTRNCILDLTAATLDNSDTGGGVLSYAANIAGGYTIANSVTIENAIGGSGDDSITGNAVANVLTGRGGNDTLIGGAGNDTLNGGAGVDTADYTYLTSSSTRLYVTLDPTAATTLYDSSGEQDTLISIENLTGSGGNDYITGDSLANVLKGGNGDDVLAGGGLGASLGTPGVFDVLDGGSGTNDADFSTETADLNIILRDATTTPGTVRVGITLEAKLTNIQSVGGGTGNDHIFGNSSANVLFGNDGDDVFVGGAGFDTLIGGNGNDTANYSAETGTVKVDMTVFNANNDNQVELQHGSDDQISGIENIIGGSAADTLTGDSGDNLLAGGGGYDRLSGGYGDDTLRPGAGGAFVDGGDGYDDTIDFSDQTGKISVTLNGSTSATFKLDGAALGTVRNVEDIVGSSYDDTLQGDDNDNHISGGVGDDILRGGAGDDHLVGGAGADYLDGGAFNYAGNTADYSDKRSAISVSLQGLDQTWDDVLVGGNVEDHLLHIQNIIGGFGNDTISDVSTSGVNNVFQGGAGIDRINGGAGYDYITGGAGSDVLDGGADSDYVSYEDKAADQSVVLTLGAGGAATYARVYQGGNIVEKDLVKNFENIIGGAGNDVLTGTSGSNQLNGNGGNDVLAGGGGFDYFVGGDGIDTIDCSSLSTSQVLHAGGYYINSDIAGQTITGYTADVETIVGSKAGDFLDGFGVTSLTGGAGNDAFVFDNLVDGSNVTTIGDFATGSDIVDLATADFAGLDTTNGILDAKDFLAGNFTSAKTADQHVIWNSTTGNLYFDADGSGSGATAIQFGVIAAASSHTLKASDIHVLA